MGTGGICVSEHCGAWSLIGELNKCGFLAWESRRKVVALGRSGRRLGFLGNVKNVSKEC